MSRRPADIIKSDLEEAILMGEFADGDRLDEASLSEKHNVSRTPVREALQMLASSGLVELVPHRGAFVRFPSFQEIVEMFEVMGELESLAARLAARRITDQQLQKLNSACQSCIHAEKTQNHVAYFRENEHFHHLIYEASGNSFLISEANRLYRRLQPIRRAQLQARGRLAQSMNEHRSIFNAIASGEGEKAADILRSHIVIQGEKFNDLIAAYNVNDRLRIETHKIG